MKAFLTAATTLLIFSALSRGAEIVELVLRPAQESGQFTPTRFSLGPEGEIFVLDRAQSQLCRFSPVDGSLLWSIDGSEGGEAFVDPVHLSRGDGFFVYLTDRGRRKVWRIDYRGEIRGSLDLPFAADPVFFEPAAGRQFVMYDRAAALAHLLDDSGRSLFSFPPGGVGNAGEPLDLTVSRDGRLLYVLRAGDGGVSVTDIFGRSARRPDLDGLDSEPLRLVAGGGLDDGFAVLTRKGTLYRALGGQTPAVRDLSPTVAIDLTVGPEGRLYLLADNPPRIIIVDQERNH